MLQFYGEIGSRNYLQLKKNPKSLKFWDPPSPLIAFSQTTKKEQFISVIQYKKEYIAGAKQSSI